MSIINHQKSKERKKQILQKYKIDIQSLNQNLYFDRKLTYPLYCIERIILKMVEYLSI